MNIDKIKSPYTYSSYMPPFKSNAVKRKLTLKQLRNEHQLHTNRGGNPKFTMPRGRAMHRLLELDGF